MKYIHLANLVAGILILSIANLQFIIGNYWKFAFDIALGVWCLYLFAGSKKDS